MAALRAGSGIFNHDALEKQGGEVVVIKRDDRTMKSIVRRFIDNRQGNIAIVFAICALPIMGLIGAAVDYSRMTQVQNRLQSAADSAALAAAATGSANGMNTTLMTATAKNYFNTNFTSDSNSSLKTYTVTTSGTQQVTVTVNATASVNMVFGGLFGVMLRDVAASSTASVQPKTYIQVVFLADVSNSMAIGGTPADIAALIAHPKIQCAFACHDVKSYQGKGDTRAFAKQAGIKLKMDYLNSAISSFMTKLTPLLKSDPTLVNVGLYTFGTNFNVPLDLTNDLSPITAAVNALDVEATLAPDSYGNNGYTYTGVGLASTLNRLTNVGDGTSPTKRKTYVVFIGDAVDDIAAPGKPASRGVGVFFAPQCAALKAAGVNVISILTAYPDTKDNEYQTFIVPIDSQREPTMKACASTPSDYFRADDGPGIQAAIDRIFNKIISTVSLTR